MPLSPNIIDGAVGVYLVVDPGRYWRSHYLEADYAEVARNALHDLPAELATNAGQMLDWSAAVLIKAVQNLLQMDELPFDHPTKQTELKHCKIAGSLLAYLIDECFFVLEMRDLPDNKSTAKLGSMPVDSIADAQTWIIARPDVRAIETSAAWGENESIP